MYSKRRSKKDIAIGIHSKETSFQKSSKDIPRILDKPLRMTMLGLIRRYKRNLLMPVESHDVPAVFNVPDLDSLVSASCSYCWNWKVCT
jgi:hypothetical protein